MSTTAAPAKAFCQVSLFCGLNTCRDELFYELQVSPVSVAVSATNVPVVGKRQEKPSTC